MDKPCTTKTGDNHQGPVKLSDTDYDYKKKNTLCFKCPERWSRTHICRYKQLQFFIVSQGTEIYLMEDEFQYAEEHITKTTTEIIELSLYSFMGWSSPTTTKLEGRLGKLRVVVLIDSGATHNFISPKTVQRARLKETITKYISVLVCTEITVSGSEVCKGVQLQLQAVRIISDFVILEPGCADIILGVQWLRTLCKCEVDWEQ